MKGPIMRRSPAGSTRRTSKPPISRTRGTITMSSPVPCPGVALGSCAGCQLINDSPPSPAPILGLPRDKASRISRWTARAGPIGSPRHLQGRPPPMSDYLAPLAHIRVTLSENACPDQVDPHDSYSTDSAYVVYQPFV